MVVQAYMYARAPYTMQVLLRPHKLNQKKPTLQAGTDRQLNIQVHFRSGGVVLCVFIVRTDVVASRCRRASVCLRVTIQVSPCRLPLALLISTVEVSLVEF